MACFKPLHATRERGFYDGKRLPVRIIGAWLGRKFMSTSSEDFPVPCSQCIGCRLERSRQWAVRMMHEASLHERNCFITLTYSPGFIPKNGSLCLEDFQCFMKRLRRRISCSVRFFHCGEYGEQFQRPHYHACLFGFDFDDKEAIPRSGKHTVYRSAMLEDLWPKGYSMIGSVDFESAAYVARYIVKKVNGKAAADHYGDRKPEYCTMSRRPGIAKHWFDLYHKDVYPHDNVAVRGKLTRPPRYYDRRYEVMFPEDYEILKARRKVFFETDKVFQAENTPERLAVRETIVRSKYALFQKRNVV